MGVFYNKKLFAEAGIERAPADRAEVLDVAHRLEPRPGDFAEGCAVEEQAGGTRRTASYPAPELMQLGQSEAFRMLDHHDRRVGHVDADLDDSGGDQHGNLAGAETLHRAVLLRRAHPPVDQPDPAPED